MTVKGKNFNHLNPLSVLEGEGMFEGRLIEFDSLGSTNSWALENILLLKNGDVIIAHRQTAGRGRFDREWISHKEDSLTMSVVLFNKTASFTLQRFIAVITATAVAQALHKLGLKPKLKWPNDVMVKGKKVCGILAERHDYSDAVVIGIGINVNQSNDAIESLNLSKPATSLRAALGHKLKTEDVYKSVLYAVETSLLDTAPAGDETPHIRYWRKHDFIQLGQRISVTTATKEIIGIYAGINKDFELLIHADDGSPLTFSSGEVSMKM